MFLVQFVQGGREYFSLAKFPPEFLRQIKYTQVQRTYKAKTGEDLLNVIPEATLAESSALVPDRPCSSAIFALTASSEASAERPSVPGTNSNLDIFVSVFVEVGIITDNQPYFP